MKIVLLIIVTLILFTFNTNVEKHEEDIIIEQTDLVEAEKIEKQLDFSDEYSILINKKNTIDNYIPEDLVEINVEFYNSNIERKYLRKEAAINLEKMFNDAKQENINLVAVSGYRSFSSQVDVYNYNVNTYGEQYANTVSAKPGTSEHQSGLAMDISCKSINYQLIEEFENTSEGEWLMNNCYRYGFIIRYEKDKQNITGYTYEPWHVRYVGKDVATYLYQQKISLEEYWSEKTK